MVGWHHWLNGHEIEQAPGDGEGQGGLEYCSPWGHNQSDMTEWLNWTELNDYFTLLYLSLPHAQRIPSWLRKLRVCLQCRRPRFDPWVGKILWRRKWQPTPEFLPEKSFMDRGAWQATVYGVTKSWTRLKQLHFFTSWWKKKGGKIL